MVFFFFLFLTIYYLRTLLFSLIFGRTSIPELNTVAVSSPPFPLIRSCLAFLSRKYFISPFFPRLLASVCASTRLHNTLASTGLEDTHTRTQNTRHGFGVMFCQLLSSGYTVPQLHHQRGEFSSKHTYKIPATICWHFFLSTACIRLYIQHNTWSKRASRQETYTVLHVPGTWHQARNIVVILFVNYWYQVIYIQDMIKSAPATDACRTWCIIPGTICCQ